MRVVPWRDDMATGAAPPRMVYVVGDDAAALHSLRLLLETEGLATRGFGSAEDVLRTLSSDARGCAVRDARLPGMDGVQLLRELKARGCLTPVIVIAGHADISAAVQAMKAGSVDFIEKPFVSEVMLRLVLSCLERNEVAVDGASRAALVARRLERLTGREREVLDRIVDGDSNKIVALRLGISPRTVEIYRANVMLKMQADSLSELVRMTLMAGAA